MRQPISITIFFPAYNEQDNLASAVEDALRVAEESPYIGDYEIVIINDGSTDATQAIAERLAAENERVRVIEHDQNRGYGSALKTGLEQIPVNLQRSRHGEDKQRIRRW